MPDMKMTAVDALNLLRKGDEEGAWKLAQQDEGLLPGKTKEEWLAWAYKTIGKPQPQRETDDPKPMTAQREVWRAIREAQLMQAQKREQTNGIAHDVKTKERGFDDELNRVDALILQAKDKISGMVSSYATSKPEIVSQLKRAGEMLNKVWMDLGQL